MVLRCCSSTAEARHRPSTHQMHATAVASDALPGFERDLHEFIDHFALQVRAPWLHWLCTLALHAGTHQVCSDHTCALLLALRCQLLHPVMLRPLFDTHRCMRAACH